MQECEKTCEARAIDGVGPSIVPRIAMENNDIRKIELIESNDPAVSVLAIGFEDFVPERYVKGWEDEEDGNNQNVVLSIQDNSKDWNRVCTAIQRSKILKELHLSGI